MPCDLQTLDALDNYRTMLAKLEAILIEYNISNVIITGDLAADPKKGRFWRELKHFMNSLSLFILDEQLPKDSFTYLCPARHTTSWLDHVLCTKELIGKVTVMKIDYEGSLYDHFPVCFSLAYELKLNKQVIAEFESKQYVNWDKLSEIDKENIKAKIDLILDEYKLSDTELFHCCEIGCKSKRHRKLCDKSFKLMKTVLLRATEEYLVLPKGKFRIIPGWNEYVEELHDIAREYFLQWVRQGKPLDGVHLVNMKHSRQQFKFALNN